MRDWQRFYDTARWQRRRTLQLKHHPLCKFCLNRGVVTRATVADHVIPHKGNWTLFSLGDLQSLCSSCHSNQKQAIEHRGYTDEVDADGWPTDPKHPANRR
jgi:5-methylcytosine-specific restriction endonuclease McrA